MKNFKNLPEMTKKFITAGAAMIVGLMLALGGPLLESASAAGRNPFINTPALNYQYRNTVIKAGLGRTTLARQPTGIWIGTWEKNPTARINAEVTRAAKAKRTPVFVIYAIPQGSCQQGATHLSDRQYRAFIDKVAAGVKRRKAIFIVEPDAVPYLHTCRGNSRLNNLRHATRRLSSTGAAVYLDAGHSNWHSAGETAKRLKRVGTRGLRGFSVNVSNYQTDANSQRWANQVARSTKLFYVVDTSRNGKGPDKSWDYWCNGDARLGKGYKRGRGWMDAQMYIKTPGESDGYCKGGPAAGVFWKRYAKRLLGMR